MNQGFFLQDPTPSDQFNERVLRYGFWHEDSAGCDCEPASAGEEQPAPGKPVAAKPTNKAVYVPIVLTQPVVSGTTNLILALGVLFIFSMLLIQISKY
jgi:hypothetical protein